MAGFAGEDVGAWPRPRLFPRPEALARSVETLPGVGPAVNKKLERLGLATVGDLLLHRPFRYEQPVDELRIAELGGEDEVAIRGEGLSVSKRRRGGVQKLTARGSHRSPSISPTRVNH